MECKRCGKEYSPEQFRPSPWGRSNYCRKCAKKVRSERRRKRRVEDRLRRFTP